MAGEAGGAGSNSSHQLSAFRASQSLADAQAERTISSGDQQGVGEQHNLGEQLVAVCDHFHRC